MHYFIDHNLLTTQELTDSFGVDGTNINKYTITSKFQLTANAKAFACQDGKMIVQQSSENVNLVNVILKPIKGLKIPFNAVKYYVYRGISKDSFIAGTVIKPKTLASSNSFLERFWIDVDNSNTTMSLPSLPEPTPKVFGFDDSLSSTLLIEKIFDNSQPDTIAIAVKEGEWIGDFGILTKIGFEIILETDSLNITDFNNQINLSYLRKGNHQIDVTGLTEFEKRAKQELLLSYIDPCAFFGLHYEDGVDISVFTGNNKTIEKKKKNDLFTLLLEKFYTKNSVYLDIRSEMGYSYNFYQNYKNATNNNIKIGNSTTTPINQVYESSSWPIVVINAPIITNSDMNDVKINLRIDDNTKPILFLENKTLLGSNNNACFLDEARILNGTSTDWSKDINLFFPNTGTGASKNNVSYYLKLYYFRQEYNASSPNTVIKNEFYFDNTYCPIDLENIADNDYTFQHCYNSNVSYTNGLLPNITSKFSFVGETGVNWDANRILFYNKALFKNERTGNFFNSTASIQNTGFSLEGNFNKISFLSKSIALNVNSLQEIVSTGVYNSVKVLDIIKNNDFSNAYEDLFCFGITQAEFTILKNLTGFTNKHHRYIYIQEITGSPFEDKDGKRFRKFELKIQGLDSTGNRLIVAPTTPIYVYTQNGLVFATKDFAEQETSQQAETYQRNYEEKIGLNIRPNTTKTYENYFIEDINPNMKVEVDGFINTLATIPNDANAYANIKTLVEDNARDIWNEAVSFVQANANTTPDDRSLYWARIKMQVALKSHLYFIGQHTYSSEIQGSEVNSGSDLEKIIQIFEEKSRNYKGVDFSLAPVGAKKILITGFDPFFLNPQYMGMNILQSNPSGCVALALNNMLTQNGLGYIQTMIVPVRYTDFDKSKNKETGQGEGIIEQYIKPWINIVDMIITVSQSLPGDYNIDKYATATRGGTIDNLGFTRKIPPFSRSINILGSNNLEWIETTLPVQFINGVVKYDNLYKDKDNIEKDGLINPPIIGEQMKSGPGGNYLSNEIFYRVAKLRKTLRPNLPTGHFHISKLQDETINEDFDSLKTIELLNIVKNAISNGATGL